MISRETARLLANRLRIPLEQAELRAKAIAPRAYNLTEELLAMRLDDFASCVLRPIVTRATLGATLGIQRRD